MAKRTAISITKTAAIIKALIIEVVGNQVGNVRLAEGG
jgi:hypothetical protein